MAENERNDITMVPSGSGSNGQAASSQQETQQTFQAREQSIMADEAAQGAAPNGAPMTEQPMYGQPVAAPSPTTADVQQQRQQMQQAQQAVAVCPYCGAANEREALFCGSCGRPLRTATCPHCGAAMDPDADFCEQCHSYVKQDTCSFCGSYIGPNDVFCPTCGSPKDGIVCPVCNTLNNFSFCKQCGQPLTQNAKAMMEELKFNPQYRELMRLTEEYHKLKSQQPYTSEKEKARMELSEDIRVRALSLLMKDKGVENPVVEKGVESEKSTEQLNKEKEALLKQLTDLLDNMQMPQTASPAHARNYAMACKPMGVRTGWVCNYKHAVHSSPCACGKPQLGGKWIVLGKG